MIVPLIEVNVQENGSQTLLKEIRHWSIFGAICLEIEGQLDEANLVSLQSVVKKMGGQTDIFLKSDHLCDEEALELLNVGGSKVVTTTDRRENYASIPDERLVFVDSDQWNVLTSPNDNQIAELETLKRFAVISVGWLQDNPEAIADYYNAILKSDRSDGLWSTIICDPLGIALGLAYSNRESLLHAIKTRQGAYWSRSRGGLWIKGLTSGATQQLLGIRFDCDCDCLRFTVTQDAPGFCHRNTHTCFGEERSIATVIQRLAERIQSPDTQSFTRKLANDAELLQKKLLEEAQELAEASQLDDRYEVAWEAADVMYFALVAMLNNGVGLEEVYAELARRMNRIVRRN